MTSATGANSHRADRTPNTAQKAIQQAVVTCRRGGFPKATPICKSSATFQPRPAVAAIRSGSSPNHLHMQAMAYARTDAALRQPHSCPAIFFVRSLLQLNLPCRTCTYSNACTSTPCATLCATTATSPRSKPALLPSWAKPACSLFRKTHGYTSFGYPARHKPHLGETRSHSAVQIGRAHV